jgi:type IV pilus assembly protein PilB
MYEVKRQFEKINFSHPLKFYRGRGCSECKNGFKGRVGIYEVLEMSETIENLVLDRKSAEEVFAQATKEGMITMRQDGMIKAVKGLTTVDEVLRATSETKEG